MIPMQYALRRRMMMAAMASVDVSALSITYTGAYTDYGMVTMSDGARYRLLAFTSSGTLSIEQPVNCEVCVVGGGADGSSGSKTEGQAGVGGAGGYLKNASLTAYSGGGVIIGAAKGASSIGGIVANGAASKNGGTGAGGADIQAAGKGDGISKYPFGDSAYEQWQDKPHCGGGSGGVLEYVPEDEYYFGGAGGTNGGDGKAAVESIKSITRATPGGKYGGGSGSKGKGSAASYYGSGGGGGTYYVRSSSSETAAAGGSGYQGIVYMRIPEDQTAYISDLPLGALINVGTDGGAGAPNYEIADKDNLVSGGVVLVRKDIHSESSLGSYKNNYPNSTLDNLIATTIYNEMPQKLRDKMMDVSFELYSTLLSASENITRKMFALTYTMLGFGNNNGVAEGKALQLYTSNASRIKTFNGSAYQWRLSSQSYYNDDYNMIMRRVVLTDGSANDATPGAPLGVVPAFVIPSETPYNATSNTDGSYNLIL